jgi:hypothetical protein
MSQGHSLKDQWSSIGECLRTRTDITTEFAATPVNAHEVLGPLVLAELAGAINVGASALLRLVLGMGDQVVGVLRSQRLHEVGAAHFQDAIDEVLEFATSRQGEMALEDDAVEAGERSDDQVGKLGDEARQRLHGVLLRKGLVQTPF